MLKWWPEPVYRLDEKKNNRIFDGTAFLFTKYKNNLKPFTWIMRAARPKETPKTKPVERETPSEPAHNMTELMCHK